PQEGPPAYGGRARLSIERHVYPGEMPVGVVRSAAADAYFDRKSTTSLVVTSGFSSMIQWPEPGTMSPTTLVATNLTTSAMPGPKVFPPPGARIGMPSLPCAAGIAWLSVASLLNAANCSKASCMAFGRAYSAA